MSIMNNDLHSNVKERRVISPVAVGTTGTGQTGKIIDRQGFGGVQFLLSYGAITSTTAVFTATVLEGDVTGTMTSVADADLIGTEALAGVAAANPRVSGTSMNVSKKIGYKGTKRYVRADVKSTATAGTLVSVTAVLFNPQHSGLLA
jgi:hypothetical protein